MLRACSLLQPLNSMHSSPLSLARLVHQATVSDSCHTNSHARDSSVRHAKWNPDSRDGRSRFTSFVHQQLQLRGRRLRSGINADLLDMTLH
ncbi:hypothetical protein BDW68DRAFT_89995 [Aspergillus falconensis]